MSIEITITLSDDEVATVANTFITYLKTYPDEAIAKSGVDLVVLAKELRESAELSKHVQEAFQDLKDRFMEDPESYLSIFGEPKEYTAAFVKIEQAEAELIAEEEHTEQDKIDAAILLLRKNGYVTKAKDEA